MFRATAKFLGKSQLEEVRIHLGDYTVEYNGKRYDTSALKWDSPATGTVYGTALNYQGALAALGDAVYESPYQAPPQAPVMYIKPANTLIGCGQPIPLPEDVTELEMGAALGVVIARPAFHVSEAEVLDYVIGYTVANDVSIPHRSVYRPAISQKCRDGFCPLGPWIIQREAVADPDRLGVRVYINGQLRQENTTANLIRSVPRLIADIAEFMTLNAGDVLLVGVPEGAPLARAGDRVRIEIEQVGCLDNIVVPEQELLGGGAA